MKLRSSEGHPDGLKVLIAAAVSGNSIAVVKDKGTASATLEVTEGNSVAHLHANSAVLYLLHASSLGNNEVEELMQWESTELKPVLLPYLSSVASGREDKGLRSALQGLFTKLSNGSQLKCEGKNGASIVIFSSLLPLLREVSSRSLVEEFPSLLTFLNTLQEVDHFKKSIYLWYGNEGCSLKPWAVQLPTPPNPSNSILTLLKGEPSSPNKTGAPADQVKRVVISAEKMLAAKTAWQNPPKSIDVKAKRVPVLPVDGETNILITASLPYVNNVPHLGNIIGCVLSGDCFARFCRLRGDNVLYICGTDEYGTATETKAIAEGLTPQQICDKYYAVHSEVYKWFNIQFDHFGRTTTDLQTKITQDIFWDLERNGMISKDSVEQLHCGKCDRFLADRFVEGTCPHVGCGYEDARGDQCDGCGKLINAVELIKPRCKLCSSPPCIKSSNHLFLDLPKIDKDYSSWLGTASKSWSSNAKVICESWYRDGLKARCITRDLKWGTPVPLEGFKDKVFYVWFDAPIGYVSITANYTSEWEKWWKNPTRVKYYEFMAKDNVPFHGVVFPSMLLGTKLSWTMVSNIIATEFLNYEDGKFSKSRGVGVFGDQAIKTGIPSDIFRFYLLFVRPEAQDTTFSWVDFQTKNNSELLNNLGNFVHRSLSFVYKFFKSSIPEAHPIDADYQIMAAINLELEQYFSAMCANRQRDGLKHILSITKIGNQYIQENEPYKLIKPDKTDEDKKRGATVIALAANIAALVSIILEPYMPETSKTMKAYLNNPSVLNRLPSAFSCFLPAGHIIQEPKPLITQLDDDTIKKLFDEFRGQTPERKTADPAEVAKMEARVAEQGNKVRDLKASGTADKDAIKAEVATLLKLKEELAALKGEDPAPSGKDKKKKGGNASKKETNSPAPAGKPDTAPVVSDPAEVDRLQAKVTEQGNNVRELKAKEGISKEEIAAEVAKLLALKNQLAIAQGIDPATLNTKDKKKKKK